MTQIPSSRSIAGLDNFQAAYYLRPHFLRAFEFEPIALTRGQESKGRIVVYWGDPINPRAAVSDFDPQFITDGALGR